MIEEVFCSGPALTNCILLGCEKTSEAVIIDAPPDSGDQVLDRIEELDLEVKCLLLTHTHWDHIADAAYLKKKLDIPIYVHKEDAYNLEHPGKDGLPLLVDVPEVKPDRFLVEGEELHVGEIKMEVIHTPGHTPGGVCFYLKEQNLLISGDTLFRGTIGNLSFKTSEPEKMWASLEKLSKLPPKTRVIPGHGEKTTIGEEPWLPNAKEYFGG